MNHWVALLIGFIVGALFGKTLLGAVGIKAQPMLLAAMVLLIIGYSMVYSAFHGDWQFWKYFLPAQQVNANA